MAKHARPYLSLQVHKRQSVRALLPLFMLQGRRGRVMLGAAWLAVAVGTLAGALFAALVVVARAADRACALAGGGAVARCT